MDLSLSLNRHFFSNQVIVIFTSETEFLAPEHVYILSPDVSFISQHHFKEIKAYTNKELDQLISQQGNLGYKRWEPQQSAAEVLCSAAACTNGAPDVYLFEAAQGNNFDRF